ncbi:MAG: hypothetical protein KKG75_04100 [Nanoarchaeota archaeon]|nr:hypothetical protein [Nanoarchaeota archaeon]
MVEKISDMEYVLWLGTHIKFPCGPGLRENYLRIAKEELERIAEVPAKEFLETIIKTYS